jgi:hypothetical protein
MKTIKILFSALLIIFLASCESKEQKAISKAADGDVMIIGKDTFDLIVDTHTVVTSERLPARNVMEEGSPVWINTTNLDSTFKSRSHVPIGSTQVYKIAKKRK